MPKETWTKKLNNRTEFKNEKEYQDYIEHNIERFCSDVLKLGKYKSHKINKSIEKKGFSAAKNRVDIQLFGSEKSAMVELKYPNNHFNEMRDSIGQCLHYLVTAKKTGVKFDKMCVVSPIYNNMFFEIIKEFNLPIEVYYLTKKYHSKIEIE